MFYQYRAIFGISKHHSWDTRHNILHSVKSTNTARVCRSSQTPSFNSLSLSTWFPCFSVNHDCNLSHSIPSVIHSHHPGHILQRYHWSDVVCIEILHISTWAISRVGANQHGVLCLLWTFSPLKCRQSRSAESFLRLPLCCKVREALPVDVVHDGTIRTGDWFDSFLWDDRVAEKIRWINTLSAIKSIRSFRNSRVKPEEMAYLVGLG